MRCAVSGGELRDGDSETPLAYLVAARSPASPSASAASAHDNDNAIDDDDDGGDSEDSSPHVGRAGMMVVHKQKTGATYKKKGSKHGNEVVLHEYEVVQLDGQSLDRVGGTQVDAALTKLAHDECNGSKTSTRKPRGRLPAVPGGFFDSGKGWQQRKKTGDEACAHLHAPPHGSRFRRLPRAAACRCAH
jgi:hypothetical protein